MHKNLPKYISSLRKHGSHKTAISVLSKLLSKLQKNIRYFKELQGNIFLFVNEQ